MGHLWSKERFAEAGLCLNMQLKNLAYSGKVILKEGAGGPESTGIHMVLRGTGSL